MVLGSIIPFLTTGGAFVFTLTNNGYKRMTLNLVHHYRKLKAPWKLCVICADLNSYRFFKTENVDCLRLLNALPETGPDPSPFGTRQFQTLNLIKLQLLSKFSSNPSVKYGIYIDSDIALYSDFLPDILERLNGCPSQILLQCDEQSRVDCSGNPSCPNGCTGFLAWSHGLPSQVFTVEGIEATTVWKSAPEDQIFVNTMLRKLDIPVITLPRNLYPNGSFTSLYTKTSSKKATTHLLHYNYLVGAAKEIKMKNNGDWLIPY